MGVPVFVTLGSNIDPQRNLHRAVGLLAEQTQVRRISHVYRSIALGPHGEPLDQPDYLNAAVLIDLPDGVAADQLKFRVLRPIEASLGRVRSADKFAPRPIDLDIALFGDLVDAALGIPDPDILTCAHIALPLADLDAHFVHPVSGETLAQIAARFVGTAGIVRLDADLTP